jgi:hypothetical protein
MNLSDNCLGVVGSCANCGNPVLEYLCNQPFWEHREASRSYDFFVCCSNILCENHKGSAVLFEFPYWVIKNGK